MSTPGRPGTSSDRSTFDAGTDAGHSPAAPAEPDTSALGRFLSDAAARRAASTSHAATRPPDWADPDPHALTALPALRHPVERAVGRYKEGRSRTEFAGKVRRECARLLGRTSPSTTWADVLAYPWHQLDVDAATAYRRAVYAAHSPQTTRNDSVCAVRAVLKQCAKVGLISPLRLDLLLEELYTVTPGPSRKRRRLTQDEADALLAACENDTPLVAARNTAMVAIFWTTGLRIGELVRLTLDDWDQAEATLLLRDTKNGHDHTVFIHPAAEPYLQRWLARRGGAAGALFGNLRQLTAPITPVSVRYMLRTRAERAGVAPFGSHDFRRTFATALLRQHDIVLVGKLLNHRKVSSTLVYDLSGEQEQRAAVAILDLPEPGSSTDAPDEPHDAKERQDARASDGEVA